MKCEKCGKEMIYAGQSIVIQEDKILKLVNDYFCWCGNTANITVILTYIGEIKVYNQKGEICFAAVQFNDEDNNNVLLFEESEEEVILYSAPKDWFKDWNNIDVEEYCNVVTNRDTDIQLFDSNLWKDLQFIARCNCCKTYME